MKEVWNAAIEAAAMQAAHCIGTETLLATYTAMEIRKLKKMKIESFKIGYACTICYWTDDNNAAAIIVYVLGPNCKVWA